MNDNAIKNYAVWARRELIAEVAKKCSFWGISDGDCPAASADSIDGRVLTSLERRQRADLLAKVKSLGYEQLVETAAYTWFNRILAIRFMEVNDRLPSHVRVFSAQDGGFAPQALQEAMDLPLDALDPVRAAELVQSGDDEGLFKLVFLAQCDQLAEYMPAVFDHVGSAMELLLPDGLLRNGGVVEQLVSSIEESDWQEGVEVIGWMYQYYVSERKDEVFASFKKGKKAERDTIAPATQLFTPNWIVRYLTENSLGRLWVLNNPSSTLPEHMPYFIKPGDDAETEFRKVSSPEEITVVDPASGSGHILVYAFDLLAQMYAEAGYSDREAARLIVEKNLSGFEIDPRAAAMASFAVTMKACELDSRFLRRGVTPRIDVLNRIEFENEEKALLRSVAKNLDLIDAAAHLDECGSLFKPSQNDLDDIARDLASLAEGGSLFAVSAAEKLGRLQAELQPLATCYDIVVANPPYMGSSNMNKWLADWTKKTYPDSKRDLCTCFINRGLDMLELQGYIAMITASSWMFISSFEQFRKKLLASGSISSMIQQSTHGYAGVTVPTTMFAFAKGRTGLVGTYIRLEDFDRPQWQEPRALEALTNPNCGWAYRRDAQCFAELPGQPIAYWASAAVANSFARFTKLTDICPPKAGLSTADNDRFLRFWWEPGIGGIDWQSKNIEQIREKSSEKKWFPMTKGGSFRKWFGNNEYVLNFKNDAEELKYWLVNNPKDPSTTSYSRYIRNYECYGQEGISFSDVSSGIPHFRAQPAGFIPNARGPYLYCEPRALLGLLNSSVVTRLLEFIAPTLTFNVGDLSKLPIQIDDSGHATDCVEENIALSKQDWDAFETSWEFKQHPLL